MTSVTSRFVSRRGWAIALIPFLGAVVLVSDCGDAGGPTPTTAPPSPAPRPPQPTNLSASFVRDAVHVAEGNAADIVVRYQVVSTNEPVPLEVSVLGVTAADDDFELSSTTLEIPAGANAQGDVSVSLTAVRDRWFAEGDEILEVQLVPPTGVQATVGPPLQVTISEAGVSPCAGIELRGTRPLTNSNSLTMEMDFASGSDEVLFDWIESYGGFTRSFEELPHLEQPGRLEILMTTWNTERIPGGTRHIMTFAWLSRGVRFRFRSGSGACAGEPTAVCTEVGCELRSSGDASERNSAASALADLETLQRPPIVRNDPP